MTNIGFRLRNKKIVQNHQIHSYHGWNPFFFLGIMNNPVDQCYLQI